MPDRNASPRSLMLERAAALLREPPSVRVEWRAALDARLGETEYEARETTIERSSWRLFAAVAAGILFVAAGIGGALTVRNRGPLPEPELARTRFAFVAPRATRVSIVGDFNQWNPAALPLKRSADGETWVIEVSLRSGRHVYAFIVDGKIARDPTAAEGEDDGFGMPNSVVVVQGT